MLSTAALALAALTSAQSAPQDGPRIDLRISIAASAGGDAPAQRVWRLRCSPVGGDWPRRAAACGRLTPALLAPIRNERRDLVPITAQPVLITGSAFGRAVTLRFGTKGSSTRRSRFLALKKALGTQAYSEAQRRSR